MDPLKMYFLLKIGIFHCYVSLPEGTIWEHMFGSLFPSASEVNPRCVGPQNTCKEGYWRAEHETKTELFPPKQTNKQTNNKQTNKQTNKQNKQTNKQTKQQTNYQTKQTNKLKNKQAKKDKTTCSLPCACCLKNHPSTGEQLILQRSWSEKSKNRVLLGFLVGGVALKNQNNKRSLIRPNKYSNTVFNVSHYLYIYIYIFCWYLYYVSVFNDIMEMVSSLSLGLF